MKSSRNLLGRRDSTPCVGRWPFCVIAVAGGLLMMSPQAHAGSWSIKLEANVTNKGTDWDDSTHKQQPTDFAKYDSNSYQDTFNYSPYPSTHLAPMYGTTSTFDKTMSVTLRLHFNPWGAGDLPDRLVAVQLRGNVGGYYSLPASGETGGAGTLTGSTGLNDGPVSSSKTTSTPAYQMFNVDGTLVAVQDNSKQEADFTIGPIILTGKGSLNNAQITTYSWYPGEGGSVSYAHTSYANSSLVFDMGLSGNISPYGLYISSGMETSWKKGTGALSAPYDKRDASGNLINAQQVAGANTPNDTSDDVWKLACLRDTAGKLTAESGAQWMTDGSFQGWFGGSSFTAQWKGFQNPTYNWTEPSNTHSANMGTTSQKDDLTPAPPTFSAPYSGIKLGSNQDGSDLTKSSTISVKVTDPSVSLSNSFVVNWHKPRDNWKNYGPTWSIWQYPPIMQLSPDEGASSGSGVTASYMEDDGYWGEAAGEAYGALTQVGSSVAPGLYGALFTAAGLVKFESKRMDVPVSFDDQWDHKDDKGNDTSIYRPYRDDSLKSRYRMKPTVRVGYTVKLWDGEVYTANGYNGQDKKAVASLDGRKEWTATFELQSGDVNDPNHPCSHNVCVLLDDLFFQ